MRAAVLSRLARAETRSDERSEAQRKIGKAINHETNYNIETSILEKAEVVQLDKYSLVLVSSIHTTPSEVISRTLYQGATALPRLSTAGSITELRQEVYAQIIRFEKYISNGFTISIWSTVVIVECVIAIIGCHASRHCPVT